jgi:hypothetical protein
MKDEILPCPMCGSPAEIDSTSVCETHHDWQHLYIYCTKEKDEHCGMELTLNADFWDIRNASELMIKCWNGLDRTKHVV